MAVGILSSDLHIAEGAFTSAVAKVLQIEEKIIDLRAELQEADGNAARANEAALRELGLDDASSPDTVLDAQERMMREAIAKSGIDKTGVVAKAVLKQIAEARRMYDEQLAAEAAALQPRGPVL